MVHKLIKIDIAFEELNISVNKILRKLKYKKDNAPEELIKAVKEEIEHSKNNYEFKAGYLITDDFTLKDGIDIKGLIFNIGTELIDILNSSQYLILFVATAGSTITKRNKMLSAGSLLLESYINDVIGNTIVESGSDILLKKIKKQYFPLKTTNRYSPGNCGWEEMDQKKFFSLFPDNFCGVTVNESQMMTPVKTINGIIGIGTNVEYRTNNCANCTSENCIYRKN